MKLKNKRIKIDCIMSEFVLNEDYINNLERELKLSKVELGMLNKTYEESLEKGSYMDVREIRDECIEKSKHIYDLQEKIQKYYYRLKQKNNSTESFTNYPVYNDSNITCTDTGITRYKSDFEIMLDELQGNLEKCTRTNRFLIHTLNIPSEMICGAEIYGDQIILQVYNFIADTNLPVFSNLENIRKNGENFDITIDYLDCCGASMCKELYKDCKITHIIARTPLSYETDDFMKNTIYITYKDVVFETPGIPKKKRTKLNESCNTEKCENKY